MLAAPTAAPGRSRMGVQHSVVLLGFSLLFTLAAILRPTYAREDASIDNSDTPELATFAGDYGVQDVRLRLTPEDGQLILYSTAIDLRDQAQLAIEAPTNTPRPRDSWPADVRGSR